MHELPRSSRYSRMEDARGSTPAQDGYTRGVRVKLLTLLVSSTPPFPFCSPPLCPDLSLVYIRSSSKPLLCRHHSLTEQQTFSHIYFIFFFFHPGLTFVPGSVQPSHGGGGRVPCRWDRTFPSRFIGLLDVCHSSRQTSPCCLFHGSPPACLSSKI